MIWTVYLPIASLVVFCIWMIRVSWRARGSLKAVDHQVTQLITVLNHLKTNTRFSEQNERWLGDIYAFITRNSFADNNPLTELVSRFYAIRDLAAPDVSAVFNSVSEHELDKLEIPRETPGNLLLLGILGTVVGLVMALASFGITGGAGEGSSVVGRLISSMFVAFISTAIAIFLSVVTKSYLEKVAIRQSGMLSELEGYAMTYLAPFLLPKQEGSVQKEVYERIHQQQSRLQESLEQTSATFAEFSNSLGQVKPLTQFLNESMNRNTAMVSQIGQRVTADLNQVNADVSNKLLKSIEMMSAELTEQRSGLELFHRDTQLAVEKEKRTSLQQTEILHRRFSDTIDVLKDNNLEMTRNLNLMTRHFVAHSEEQTASIHALRQDVAQLSERLIDSQEIYQQTFLQTVQNFLHDQFSELAKGFGLKFRGKVR
jgi:hypothetical protein